MVTWRYVGYQRGTQSALKKIQSKHLVTGETVHSFDTLMASLTTIVRNVCKPKLADSGGTTFTMDTIPTKEQQRAFDLLATIKL